MTLTPTERMRAYRAGGLAAVEAATVAKAAAAREAKRLARLKVREAKAKPKPPDTRPCAGCGESIPRSRYLRCEPCRVIRRRDAKAVERLKRRPKQNRWQREWNRRHANDVKERACSRCGTRFTAKGATRSYCDVCNRLASKEWSRRNRTRAGVREYWAWAVAAQAEWERERGVS